MREEFVIAVRKNQASFGLDLPADAVEKLADYYELVQAANSLLHLVAPCPPEEFAIRHILESLLLLKYVPQNTKFADVGTGAGLPSIPCLLVRTDLRAKLIETKEKKIEFLTNAATNLSLSGRVEVINRQFTETDPADCQFVTCRALDKFTEKVPRLIVWAKRRPLILFAGPRLRDEFIRLNIRYDETLIPMSDRRYVFLISP